MAKRKKINLDLTLCIIVCNSQSYNLQVNEPHGPRDLSIFYESKSIEVWIRARYLVQYDEEILLGNWI